MSEKNANERLKKIYSFASDFKVAVHQLSRLDHCESKYGTEISIHGSEMHHLEIIKKLDGPYAAKIAESFNVTKGAVSQILLKLEKKKLIYKSPDPTNKSRKLIYLTDLGERACKGHAHIHNEMNKILLKVFDEISTKDIDVCLKLAENLKKVALCKELEALFRK